MTAYDLEKSFSFNKTVEITGHQTTCIIDSRVNTSSRIRDISRGVGVRKVSNSKGELQGILTSVKNSVMPPKFKMGHMTLTTPFQGLLVIRRLERAMINLSTKFEVSASTPYAVMNGEAECTNRGGLGYLGVT